MNHMPYIHICWQRLGKNNFLLMGSPAMLLGGGRLYVVVYRECL